jgi:hypothetical protein
MKKYEDYTYKEKKEALKEDQKYREWIHSKLLQHLREGFSPESLGIVAASTLQEYIKKHPETFDLGEIETAMNEGRNMWERLGHAQSNGKNLGNSRTWFYNMANRYGWSERSKVDVDAKQAVTVQVISYADTPTQ